MNPDLSAFVEAAAREARINAGKVRVNDAALARSAGLEAGAEASFCDFWPVIKAGLELLKGLVPAWAKWLIDAVIAIGDKVCSK